MSLQSIKNLQEVRNRKFGVVMSYKMMIQGNRRKVRETKSRLQTSTTRTVMASLRCFPNSSQCETCHLELINVARNGTELLIEKTQPVYLANYCAVPKTRELKKSETEKILAQNVTRHTPNECAPPIVFAAKKNGKLIFCVDYRKFNAASERAF